MWLRERKIASRKSHYALVNGSFLKVIIVKSPEMNEKEQSVEGIISYLTKKVVIKYIRVPCFCKKKKKNCAQLQKNKFMRIRCGQTVTEEERRSWES